MNNVEQRLRDYDKFLSIKGRINGEKVIIRQSPFNKLRYHDIFVIRNKFLGSCYWILKKLMLMDGQRHNFVKSTLQHNERIKRSTDKYDHDMCRDVVKFIKEDEKILI